MSNFKLEITGEYNISYKNEKIVKILVKGTKNKNFPLVSFDEDTMKLLIEHDGEVATFTSNDGYLSTYKGKEGQWVNDVTCIISEIKF